MPIDAGEMLEPRGERCHDVPARGGIVVTGLGMTTPLGGDVSTTWTALIAAESGVSVLEDIWADQLAVRIAGRLHTEPTKAVTRKQARRLDRSQQVAVVAAREAWI